MTAIINNIEELKAFVLGTEGESVIFWPIKAGRIESFHSGLRSVWIANKFQGMPNSFGVVYVGPFASPQGVLAEKRCLPNLPECVLAVEEAKQLTAA